MSDIPDKKPIPVACLRRRLCYEPTTGKLFWRPRLREDFPSDRAFGNWTARFANKEAFLSRHADGYRTGEMAHEGARYYLLAHVVIWAIVTGAYPDHEIDHRDGDAGNNRLSNLRQATRLQNVWNSVKRGQHLTGASPSGRRWKSSIRVGGKIVYLGTFETEAEAHLAYCAKADEVRGAYSPQRRAS